MATLDSGPMAILFAAMHPERVSALILLNCTARYVIAPDYPIGHDPDVVDAVVQTVAETWGTPDFIRLTSPDFDFDDEAARLIARTVRSSARLELRQLRTRPYSPRPRCTCRSPRLSKHPRWYCTFGRAAVFYPFPTGSTSQSTSTVPNSLNYQGGTLGQQQDTLARLRSS